MNLRRDVFQAIADPTRRAILLLVAAQSMTAGAIAANFDSARPTISKHLQILTECGLLESSQSGREIYYSLEITGMKEIDEWIGQFRQLLETSFSQLDVVLANLNEKEKNDAI